MSLLNLSRLISQRLSITTNHSTPVLTTSLLYNNIIIEECQRQLLPASLEMLLGGVRYKILRPRVRKPQEGEDVIKYSGFNYYPRSPNHVDPPYEPSKLFAVRRIKTLKRRPYWERRVVEGELKLADRRTVAIVKNTPSECAKLYSVKHLIKIIPITTPNGMPTDPKYSFLKENGEFISYDQLETTGMESVNTGEQDVKALLKRDVDGRTLKRRLKLQWQSLY